MTDVILEVPALVSPALTVTVRPPGARNGGRVLPQYGLPFGAAITDNRYGALIASVGVRASLMHHGTQPSIDSGVYSLLIDVGVRTKRERGEWQRYADFGVGGAVTALTISRYDPILTGGMRVFARLGWTKGEGDVRPLVAVTGDTQLRLDSWTGSAGTAAGDLDWTFRPAWAGLRAHVGVRF